MSDSFPNSLMSGHLNSLTHATHLSFCQQTSQNDKMLFDHHPFAGYPEPNRHCVIDQLNINQESEILASEVVFIGGEATYFDVDLLKAQHLVLSEHQSSR